VAEACILLKNYGDWVKRSMLYEVEYDSYEVRKVEEDQRRHIVEKDMGV